MQPVSVYPASLAVKNRDPLALHSCSGHGPNGSRSALTAAATTGFPARAGKRQPFIS